MVATRDGTKRLQGRDVGTRIALPRLFIGLYVSSLSRYNGQCQKHGKKLDLFITFICCNPQWKEIVNALLPGQTSTYHPNITSCVFYQKYKDTMHLLTKRDIFGKVLGYFFVIFCCLYGHHVVINNFVHSHRH